MRCSDCPPDKAPTAEGARRADEWRRLVDYYLRCVQREGLLTTVELRDKTTWSVLPLNEEPVISANEATVPRSPELDRLFEIAQSGGEKARAVYYGWPTVVASRDDKHLVCGPMAFVELRPGEDEVRRPDDAVRFHGGLLHGSHFAAEDLDQAAPLLRRNIPSGNPTQVCELFEEIARVLRLPGEALDAAHLNTGAPPRLVGVYNRAMAFVAEADGYTDMLVRDLKGLRTRQDWGGTAARWLFDSPPAPAVDRAPVVAPVEVSASQEGAVRMATSSPLTLITGPPGTGKSQVVAALVATCWQRGETALVASTNNAPVDTATGRARALHPFACVRTGNAEARAAVETTLRQLVDEAGVPAIAVEEARAQMATASSRRELVEVEVGKCVRRLAVLSEIALRLETLSTRLWGQVPPPPITPGDRLKNQARRRARALLFGDRRRRRLLQRVGVPLASTDASTRRALATTLTEWATGRSSWEAQHRAEARDPLVSPSEQRARLQEADEEWRRSSLALVGSLCDNRLREGRAELAALLAPKDDGSPPVRGRFTAFLPTVPCWATTALSVRPNFALAPAMFDMVIIDEASQCLVSHILPLAYRARRLVVIGDEVQLAPISRLPAAELEQLAAEAGVAHDELQRRHLAYGPYSAFSAFGARLGRSPHVLTEHYRCHPQIIRYCNEEFYGNRLEVLTPSDRYASAPVIGLTWFEIQGRTEPGARSGQVNRREAEAVVRWLHGQAEEAEEAALADDAITIGVVTPFAAQAALVRQLVEQLPLSARKRLRQRQLRVGTAHSFQGDERTVMAFSTVMSEGTPPGSAAWVERERNLVNVAVSRAKAGLVIFGDSIALRRLKVRCLVSLHEVANRAEVADSAESLDEPSRRLVEALLVRDAKVVLRAPVGGRPVELLLEGPNGPVVVQCDRGDTDDQQASRRRTVLQQDEEIGTMTGSVVRVPAWRCVVEPEQVADGLLRPRPVTETGSGRSHREAG